MSVNGQLPWVLFVDLKSLHRTWSIGYLLWLRRVPAVRNILAFGLPTPGLVLFSNKFQCVHKVIRPTVCFRRRLQLLTSNLRVVCQIGIMSPRWLVHLRYVAPATEQVGQKYDPDDLVTHTHTHTHTKSWLPRITKANLLAS